MAVVQASLELLLDGIRWCAGVVLLLGTFAHLCLWLAGRRVVRPRLYFKPSSLSRHLQRHMSALERPFTVPRLLTPRHLQTLLGPLVAAAGASSPPLLYRRQYLQLRDRCSLPLDWAEPMGGGAADPSARVLLVLPDLLLDDSRLYAPVCRRALSAGCLPVVVNFRQLVRKNLPATRVAALYDVTDLRWVVRYLCTVCPGRRLAAVGFGNGGSLLLAYLGEHGISCQLTAAAVVSPAWGCAAHLLGDACAPYATIATIREKYRLCRRVADVSAATGGATADITFADFHRRVHGEDEERHNPIIDIDEVAVPLLAVHADDDPVYGAADLPLQLFTAFPHLFLLRAPLGGHCGFYTAGGGVGKGDGCGDAGGVSWAADTAVQFIDCVCAFLDAEDAGGAGGVARAARRVAARVARRAAAAAARVKSAGRTPESGGLTPESVGRTPEDPGRTPESVGPSESVGRSYQGVKCSEDTGPTSDGAVRSLEDGEKSPDDAGSVMKSTESDQSKGGEICEQVQTRTTFRNTLEGDSGRIAKDEESLHEDGKKVSIVVAKCCTACGEVIYSSSGPVAADRNGEVITSEIAPEMSEKAVDEGTLSDAGNEISIREGVRQITSDHIT